MLGAIIGDIVGSRFEFVEEDNRGKNFALFTKSCRFTDDSCMTLAIAKALFLCKGDYGKLRQKTISCMQELGRAYPKAGYGYDFYHKWLMSSSPKPYNSYGNGSAMRVSPVAWVADSEEQLKELSLMVTDVTHNHPEGIKGAEAIAMGIYLARLGKSKEEIREKLSVYYPILKNKYFTIKSLCGNYGYDFAGGWVTCQGSVPQAIIAFLESENFEDAIRNAVCIGGDSDTIGAMAGSIAEAYYGVSYDMEDRALEYLPEDLKSIYFAFNMIKGKRR
jgi:type I restriction enzyme M protein